MRISILRKAAVIAASIFAVCAARAATDAGFSAVIAASLQDPKMEWWFNIPADSAPRVSHTERVFFHQEFSLFTLFEKADVRDGSFKIVYSVSSIDPDGKCADIAKDVKLEGKKNSKNVIAVSTESIAVCFDKNYKEGVYEFELSARDEISGQTAKAKTFVRLGEWSPPIPPNDAAKVKQAIYTFYLNPSPETLYAAFYSNALNLEQKDAPNALNYTYVGFFRAAFLRNSFMLPYLRRAFPDATPIDRAKTIFLFAILGEPRIDFNILTPKEKEYQDSMRAAEIPGLYKEWSIPLGGVQIDMLWGEFFADGSYKPVRRIIDLLAYADEGAFAEKMLSSGEKPADKTQWRKLMMGAYRKAALQTLLINAQKYPLVEKYCLWAIENKDLPESSYELLKDIRQ